MLRNKYQSERSKAVRDWSLSFLHQKSRAWNFWRRRLRCKSLLCGAVLINVT
ncbi:hypothetical protein HMPREF9104_02558 [Lentilactobacillus kisonensis F0435]|uniref:Uncharacterized protein n=1 Tax=Lentilactobacillus kisonensis F0435 TaxID=797516 RepID=H1LIW6_9LACO|nr:hypothetical protein HMPREF9104_02558 [Lentilactobacillus kisonensis F0435]